MQVQLVSTNGATTLSTLTGLTFTVGDGTADATMTFTGTVAAVNTALSGLSFNPTTGFTGAASLQIVTSDQGNTGSGGTLTDTDTVTITVARPRHLRGQPGHRRADRHGWLEQRLGRHVHRLGQRHRTSGTPPTSSST